MLRCPCVLVPHGQPYITDVQTWASNGGGTVADEFHKFSKSQNKQKKIIHYKQLITSLKL